MSSAQRSRSKTPEGARFHSTSTVQPLVSPQGVNPYRPIVSSVHNADILHAGRTRVSKKIVQATSRSGRESIILFVDEVVEGRRVLDKFRLCIMISDSAIDIESWLAGIKLHRIEWLGANYYMIYIDQRSYDTRACCGVFDLSWLHLVALFALMLFAGILLLFAAKADFVLQLVEAALPSQLHEQL
jgi:hypothetical protein